MKVKDFELPKSKLTKKQVFKSPKKQISDDESMIVEIRFDDECGNGHNSFAVTSEIRENGRMVSCGCQHDEVKAHFPEYSHLIKWHLCSTDGPLHYLANTIYHAENGDLKYAQDSAIWPEATSDQLQDKILLSVRLPELMQEFKKAVESVGFVY